MGVVIAAIVVKEHVLDADKPMKFQPFLEIPTLILDDRGGGQVAGWIELAAAPLGR
jgi:hypothetical protein